METHSQKFKIRLGLFITGGIILFFLAIFIIGRQKNLFNPVYRLNADFYNVSGLQVGNNVRFSGIDIGTVDNISIVNDSTVRVNMLIKREVQKFIKVDSEVGIGSEGIIGDRLIVISQGSGDAQIAKDGQHLYSTEPVETDAIMSSLEVTASYAEVIAGQMAQIMVKINSGQGALGQLIQDSTFAKNLNQTMLNLKKSSKGLNENMEAAKHNVFLRGFFKKKQRDQDKKKEVEQKAKENDTPKKAQ